MKKQVKNNVSMVGHIDWELKKFHGDDYDITSGSSQNAYLIEEEKTVLIDTVWSPHAQEFVKNLKRELGFKKLDCVVVNHGEADHSGALPALLEEMPGLPIYCTEAAVKSLKGQYGGGNWNFKPVKTGDKLDLGNGKELIFVEMKMLHWPDSMATYLTKDNVLFSMDAFGQHLATEELFNDKVDKSWLYDEALKYFVNILNPFAPIITRKLEEIKAFGLPFDIIAPSHGVIWRQDPLQIVESYAFWAKGQAEDQVTVVYDTMWNGTKELAHMVVEELNTQSPGTVVKLFNIPTSDKNEIAKEVFRSKAIAVGAPTCLNSIPSSVSGCLDYLKTLKFRGKKAAAFGCYGWSGEGAGVLKAKLEDAGFAVAQACVQPQWKPSEKDEQELKAMVAELLG